MKNIFLIYIYINHLIKLLYILTNKILDRVDLVVDIMFFSAHITGKTPYPIIDNNNIRVKTMNQIVQCLQW